VDVAMAVAVGGGDGSDGDGGNIMEKVYMQKVVGFRDHSPLMSIDDGY